MSSSGAGNKNADPIMITSSSGTEEAILADPNSQANADGPHQRRNSVTSKVPRLQDQYAHLLAPQSRSRASSMNSRSTDSNYVSTTSSPDMTPKQLPMDKTSDYTIQSSSPKPSGRKITSLNAVIPVTNLMENISNQSKEKKTTSFHYVSSDEASVFAEWIRSFIEPENDPELAHLFTEGKTLNNETLFEACQDGWLLAKVINQITPGTIDMKQFKPSVKKAFVYDNVSFMLAGAKKIGVRMNNIGVNDILEGVNHLILSLVWQLSKIAVLSKVNIETLGELLSDSEKKGDIKNITQETLLLKWVNFHLNAAGSQMQLKNFTGDLKDSKIYATLMMQLVKEDPRCEVIKVMHDACLEETDLLSRAQIILKIATTMGIKVLLSPSDIIQGIKDRQLAFMAQIFDEFPGLGDKGPKKRTKSMADLADKKAELETANEKLKLEIEKKKQEELENMRNLEMTKQNFEQLQKSLAEKETVIQKQQEVFNQNQKLQEQIQELMAKQESIERSNKQLKREVDHLKLVEQEKDDLLAFTKEMNEEIDNLKKANETTTSLRQDLEKHIEKLNEEITRLKDVEKEKEDIASVSQQTIIRIGLLAKEKEALEKEKEDLESINNQLRADIEKLKEIEDEKDNILDEKQQIIEQHFDLEQKVRELKNQIKVLEQDKQSLSDNVAQLNDQLSNADKQLKDSTEKESKLAQQNDLLNREINRLKLVEVEKESLLMTSKDVGDQVQQLVKEKRAIMEERLELEKVNIELEQEIDRLKDVETAKSKLEQDLKQAKDQITSVNQQKQQIESQLSDTEDQIAKLKRDLEKITAEDQKKQKIIDTRTQQCEDLEQNILERDDTIKKQLRTISDLEIKNSDLEARFKITDAGAKNLEGVSSNLQGRINQLEKEVSRLRDEIDNETKLKNYFQRENTKLIAEIQKLQSEVDKLIKETAQKSESIQQLENERNNVKAELSKIRNQKQIQDVILNTVHDDLEHVLDESGLDISYETKSLESISSAIIECFSTLMANIDAERQKSESTQSEIQRLQRDELEVLQSKLKKLTDEHRQQKEEYEDLKVKYDTVANDIAGRTNQITTEASVQREKIRQLERQLAARTAEIEEWKNACAILRRETSEQYEQVTSKSDQRSNALIAKSNSILQEIKSFRDQMESEHIERIRKNSVLEESAILSGRPSERLISYAKRLEQHTNLSE